MIDLNIAGDGCEILMPVSERKTLEEIERSITTTYKRNLFGKFVKGIKTYNLIDIRLFEQCGERMAAR